MQKLVTIFGALCLSTTLAVAQGGGGSGSGGSSGAGGSGGSSPGGAGASSNPSSGLTTRPKSTIPNIPGTGVATSGSSTETSRDTLGVSPRPETEQGGGSDRSLSGTQQFENGTPQIMRPER